MTREHGYVDPNGRPSSTIVDTLVSLPLCVDLPFLLQLDNGSYRTSLTNLPCVKYPMVSKYHVLSL
jgi:hypothetical protein